MTTNTQAEDLRLALVKIEAEKLQKSKKAVIIKGILGASVSLGAGMVVGYAVKAITPVGIGKLQQVMLQLGSFGIGGVVGEKASSFTSGQVDNILYLTAEGKVAVQVAADVQARKASNVTNITNL